MTYTQDITDCFASEIGDGGLDHAVFEGFLEKTGALLNTLGSRMEADELPFLSLPASFFCR